MKFPRKMKKVSQKDIDSQATAQRKRYRARPGTKAIRMIKAYQKSGSLLIPRAPFRRLVREMAGKEHPQIRFTKRSIPALQEATEQYLVELFHNAQIVTTNSDRFTVMPKDISVACQLRGNMGLCDTERVKQKIHAIQARRDLMKQTEEV